MKIYQSNEMWHNDLDQYTFWISTKRGTSWCNASNPDRNYDTIVFPSEWCDSIVVVPKVYDDQQNVLENE